MFVVLLETTANAVLAATTTNVFGDFSFAGLAAGTYLLYFTLTGDPVVHSMTFTLK